MCARYEIDAPPEDLAEVFALGEVPQVTPRWNAAPTQMLPIVRAAADGSRRLDLVRWGLVPAWAEDVKIGSRMINARAETVATKPSFRAALRRRRCLVPVTGFYEWTGEAGHKRAWIFRFADGRPFAFAGLWETWQGAGAAVPLVTFTILTTSANELVARVHDRMPVVVDHADHATWLDPRIETPARLQSLLVPAPASNMTSVPVGPAVNDPRHEGPSCAAPAGPAGAP
jgi:putative SOS response-associated peptidase YedK